MAAFARYGFTLAGIYLLWSVLFYVLNIFVIRRFGDSTLPVLAVVASLFELTIIFGGPGQAAKPLVGIYYAEGSGKAVKKTVRVALRSAVIEGAAAAVAVFVLADVIPLVFNIRDPATMAQCSLALRIIALSLVPVSYVYYFCFYYISVGRTGLSVWLAVWKDLLSVLALTIPLGLIFGVPGFWAGFLLAPFLTLLLWYAAARLRCPGMPFPLLDEQPFTADFDLRLSQEEILEVRKRTEEFLTELHLSDSLKNRAMLLVEDLSLLAAERNGAPEKVCAEWTIMAGDSALKMIYRDNGEVMDLSDPDERVSSFRAFVISSVMEEQEIKKYLLTTGMNRSIFELPYDLNKSDRSEEKPF